MIQWRNQYRDRRITASLKYLIEGTPEQFAAKCPDGCGAVVKCGFPTVKQLNVRETQIIELIVNLCILFTVTHIMINCL